MAQMTKRDDLLSDLRVQRVVSLLGQFGLGNDAIARRLRQLAEWYSPTGMRTCERCGELFKPRRRTARYCTSACRKAAFRRNKAT